MAQGKDDKEKSDEPGIVNANLNPLAGRHFHSMDMMASLSLIIDSIAVSCC
jgi:hypothetical protein